MARFQTAKIDKTELYSSLFNDAKDGILLLDISGKILDANVSLLKVLGYESCKDLIGKSLLQIIPKEYIKRYNQYFDSLKKSTVQYIDKYISLDAFEFYGFKKNGQVIPLEITISIGHSSESIFYIVIVRDITRRKAQEERLMHMEHYDMLTKLLNKHYFFMQLKHTIEYSKRYKNSFCLMYLNLDNFDVINKKFGNFIGDTILIKVARRLKECVRKPDIIARFSGDEFSIIIDNIDSRKDAQVVAKKIITTLGKPFNIGRNSQCKIGVSIGMNLYNSRSTMNPSEVILNAEEAMRYVKRKGKNDYMFYADLVEKRQKNKE